MLSKSLPEDKKAYWTVYLNEPRNRLPSELGDMMRAHIAPSARDLVVMDVGSAAGEDVIEFAKDKRIKTVHALDALPEAGRVLHARVATLLGPQDAQKVIFREQVLEDLKSGDLPEVDMMLASAVLPYVRAESYDSVMPVLLGAIKPRGLFYGMFCQEEGRDEYDMTLPMTLVGEDQIQRWLQDSDYTFQIHSVASGDPAVPRTLLKLHIVLARRNQPKR